MPASTSSEPRYFLTVPVRVRRHSICALIALAAVGSSCGGSGGGGGDNDGVALTEHLSTDADYYSAVDLTLLREDLDLPEDADPLAGDLAPFGSIPLNPLLEVADTEVRDALELPFAYAAAGADTEDGFVGVIGTTADTGEVGSVLGDLGFRDQAGVLVNEGKPGAVAVRLDLGLIYVSQEPAALRTIPAEPADDPPTELLGELDAPVIQTIPPPACGREAALTANADGSGELVYLINGGADATKLEPSSDGGSGATFGEPEVDGDLIELPIDLGESDGLDARNLRSQYFIDYEC